MLMGSQLGEVILEYWSCQALNLWWLQTKFPAVCGGREEQSPLQTFNERQKMKDQRIWAHFLKKVPEPFVNSREEKDGVNLSSFSLQWDNWLVHERGRWCDQAFLMWAELDDCLGDQKKQSDTSMMRCTEEGCVVVALEGAGAKWPNARGGPAGSVVRGCCGWPAQTCQQHPEVWGKESNLSPSHHYRSFVRKTRLIIASCCAEGCWAMQSRRETVTLASLEMNCTDGRLDKWDRRGKAEGIVYGNISLNAGDTFSVKRMVIKF